MFHNGCGTQEIFVYRQYGKERDWENRQGKKQGNKQGLRHGKPRKDIKKRKRHEKQAR